MAALAPIDGGVAPAALLGLRASGGGWSAALGPLGGHPPARPGGDGSPAAAWAPDLGSGLAFGLGRCPGDGHPGGTGDGERLPGQPGGLALAGRGLAVLLQRAGDAAGLRVDGPLPGGEGAVPHRTGPPRVSPLATRRGAPRARRSRRVGSRWCPTARGSAAPAAGGSGPRGQPRAGRPIDLGCLQPHR